MPTTPTNKKRTPQKDATIQIRVPASVKQSIAADAARIGMSLSEYARASIITGGKFQRDVEEFWATVAESEAEYEAGLGTPTSAAELIQIARKARGEA